MSTVIWLEPVSSPGSQKDQDFCTKTCFQQCLLDQLDTQLNRSLSSNFDTSVWGLRAEIMHFERPGGCVQLIICAKKSYYSCEPIPKNGSTNSRGQWLGDSAKALKFIKKVFSQKSTSTVCNSLNLNFMRPSHDTWITHGKKNEIIQIGLSFFVWVYPSAAGFQMRCFQMLWNSERRDNITPVDRQGKCISHPNFYNNRFYSPFLIKIVFIFELKQLKTEIWLKLQLLRSLFEYNQYVAEVRDDKRRSCCQQKNDVTMETENQQVNRKIIP